MISQNKRILNHFHGTGKTFTAKYLEGRMSILRPSARVYDLRDQGYDVRSLRFITLDTRRSAVRYRIMQRKVA
jgi:hypothetical protein|tara:strand:- start:191 stop:409 length:219 start_codon:yes stop_codon:yes gene_type:complete